MLRQESAVPRDSEPAYSRTAVGRKASALLDVLESSPVPPMDFLTPRQAETEVLGLTRKRSRMLALHDLLFANPYPGRGVLCARTHSGAVLGGYFLTGRSPASRDRALRLIDGELVVGPLTPGEHDSLRHYAAATTTGDWLVLGNGEQVSQAAERLRAGASPTDALSGFEYEPDPPIRTSRLTALISRDGGRTTIFGAARPSRAARLTSNVMTLAVQDLAPGEAVLLTTYNSDGEQVSVAAPFTETTVSARNGEDLLDEIWSALDEKFRIAAAVLDPAQEPGSAIQRSA